MKRGLAAVLLVVGLVLAGCGGATDAVTNATPPNGAPPLPAGANEVTKLPGNTADTSCGDPRASLRPDGATNGPSLAKIRASGKLVVGLDQNTFKFGYRNPETGEISGFDVDMAKAVTRAIFGTDQAMQIKVLTSATRIDAVKKGEVDLVVQTMTMNCERWKDVSFSAEYYEAGQRVLVKNGSGFTGIGDLGGKKVCAAEGSTSIKNIVNQPSKPIGVQVPGWTDCLVMLQQNQVDAISTDDTILAGLRDQDPHTTIVGEPFTSEPYGMAIAKDRPDLVRFVNSVLEQMRSNSQWTQIYNTWLTGLVPGTHTQPVPRYQD